MTFARAITICWVEMAGTFTDAKKFWNNCGRSSLASKEAGMRLAISNIAWPVEQDAAVAALLRRQEVCAVEIAPTKIWPSPTTASPAEVRAYRKAWRRRGVRIVAAQALLFGKPELTVFQSAEIRHQTLDYLDAIARVCADLGAESLVFGSPRNRCRHGLPAGVVQQIAVEFFGALGEMALRYGTAFVLEANPAQYGTDFLTGAAEAISLVRQVNHPGLRLHFDIGCMTLSNDAIEAVVSAGAGWLHHVHVSEPHLAPIGSGGADHQRYARSLQAIGYDRWCSIEMKMAEPFAIEGLEAAIKIAQADYSWPAAPALL
jgi:sugar phosphate isomerase/epimerase